MSILHTRISEVASQSTEHRHVCSFWVFTTNTTLFYDANPDRVRKFFDAMMELGVEGMMISPGYSYQKAPDQQHFLKRERTRELFSRILGSPKKGWQFNQSPLFLDFLMGRREYECTPWGNPTSNVVGWQEPCYLLQEGYAKTFRELVDSTEWDQYGTGRNEKCADSWCIAAMKRRQSKILSARCPGLAGPSS